MTTSVTVMQLEPSASCSAAAPDPGLVGLHQAVELGLTALAVEGDPDRARQRRSDLLEHFLLVFAGDAPVRARPDQQPPEIDAAAAAFRSYAHREDFVVGAAFNQVFAGGLTGHQPA